MSNSLLDLVPASGTVLPTHSVWATVLPVSAFDLPGIKDPLVVSGAVPTLTVPAVASAVGVLPGHFLYDFYYRIWVVPEVLTAQNPQYNTPIPFKIWNAYPEPTLNRLETITYTDGTGLSLDVAALTDFKAIELRTVNVSIAESAGIAVDARIDFGFDVGSGTLYFKAEIADFVKMVPQIPVKETWQWLTTNLVAWDGTEQRIAVRDAPRTSASITVLLRDEVDYQAQYNRLYKSLGKNLIVPYYQYTTVLTQDSASGTSTLYFDPAKTDVREGEFALVFDSVAEQGYLVKLGAENIGGDGYAVASPLTFDAKKSYWIAPAFTSYLSDGSGLTMQTVYGSLQLDCNVLAPRVPFKRPGSTATWPTLNGYPILESRPNADQDVPDSFIRNIEVFDYDSGIVEQKATWAHPFVGGKRQYFIARTSNPEQMDFWRDFLYYCRGMQNPFLAPTFRTDLFLHEPATAGSSLLHITSLDFLNDYYAYQSTKHICIELADGRLLYRQILDVTNSTDFAELTLDQPFGTTAADLDIAKVSFLNLVRLDSDTVTLTHYHTYTLLELSLRTIDG